MGSGRVCRPISDLDQHDILHVFRDVFPVVCNEFYNVHTQCPLRGHIAYAMAITGLKAERLFVFTPMIPNKIAWFVKGLCYDLLTQL